MVVAFDQGATNVCFQNGVVTMPADEQMETACVCCAPLRAAIARPPLP